MSDLISRQAAIAVMDCISDSICGQEAIDALWELPTIEAEPRKHGRWIYGERMPFGVNVFAVKCSECGYNTVSDGLSHKYNYCPNCGAIMDESTMSQLKPQEPVNDGGDNR